MNERIIQVEGRSQLRVAPDLAIIKCGLSFFAVGFRESQNGLNERVAQIRAVAPGLELSPDDFKTSEFEIDRTYQELDDKRKIYGYRSSHSLRLELPLEMKRVNAIVAACAGSGAEPEIDVIFTLKDCEPVRLELMSTAIQTARERAETLASAAGVKLGEVKRIEYGTFDVRVTSYQFGMSQDRFCEEGPALNPGDLDASDKVSVTWLIA
jgi:uncharacterized protein YggE